MFGFSIGEVLLLVIVAIILVGPRQLPSMLRTAGQWIGKLRRMAFDMRSQSGIDQLLRDEGLEKDIKELRRLLAIRRGNVLDALTVDIGAEVDATPPPALARTKRAKGSSSKDDVVTLLTEFPLQGADAYGAVPEDVAPYMDAAPQEQPDTRTAASEPLREELPGTVATTDEAPPPAEPAATVPDGETAAPPEPERSSTRTSSAEHRTE